jgi:hypothetical protein
MFVYVCVKIETFAGGKGTDMCIAFCGHGQCATLGHEKWETPFAVIREIENVRKIDQRICTPICKGNLCHRIFEFTPLQSLMWTS